MSKEQVLDKGIRQKSTKEWTQFIAGSAFCTGPQNREPTDSEKRLRVYASASAMARHGWCVDKAPGQNTHKSECMFRRSPIAVPTKNCVFIQPLMWTGYYIARVCLKRSKKYNLKSEWILKDNMKFDVGNCMKAIFKMLLIPIDSRAGQSEVCTRPCASWGLKQWAYRNKFFKQKQFWKNELSMLFY